MSSPSNATISTGAGLALGPQALVDGLGWLAGHYELQPVPTDGALMTAAILLVWGGGGLVWLLVTLVQYALKERGIINVKDQENASV